MTLTTGVASTIDGIFNALETALTAAGWTIHENNSTTGRFGASTAPGTLDPLSGTAVDVGFAARWDDAHRSAALFQFTGVYDTNNPDESGNGNLGAVTAANNRAARSADIFRNAPTQERYWIFATSTYFYVITEMPFQDVNNQRETSTFGAGACMKYNDFMGGEFVFGSHNGPTNLGSNLNNGGHTFLLDGRSHNQSGSSNNMQFKCATYHVEGLDDQPAGGKYGVCAGGLEIAELGQDRQAVPVDRVHILGGYGAGIFARPFSKFEAKAARASAPLWNITQVHYNRVTGALALLSHMPDIYGMRVEDYADGDEFDVGGVTYVAFGHRREGFFGQGQQGFCIKK